MRELITSESYEELFAKLTPEMQDIVKENGYKLFPGQNENKPVVLNHSGNFVPGSGRWPNANDPVQLSKDTAYKKTNSYRQALEGIVSLDGDENRKGSFLWWVAKAMEAAEGSPQQVACPSCGERSVYAFKQDGNLIFKIIELMHGKARESQDINVQSHHIVEALNERVPVSDLKVRSLDSDIIEARFKEIKESE